MSSKTVRLEESFADPEDLDAGRSRNVDHAVTEYFEDLPKSKKRLLQMETDEKYRGTKVSKKDLEMDLSEETLESEDDESFEGDTLSEFDSLSDDDSIVSKDEQQELEDDGEMDVLYEELNKNLKDQPKLFANQTALLTPAQEGSQVMQVQRSLGQVFETRLRLQPLLQLANRVNMKAFGRRARKELDLKAMIKQISSLEGENLNHLWGKMEERHQELMYDAKDLLDTEFQLPVVSGKKRQPKKLRVINQSLWSQVQKALTEERDRLKGRLFKARTEIKPLTDSPNLFLDDIDFLASLLKDHATNSLTANTTVKFDLKKETKKAVQGRISKGRKLHFDVQEKLVGLVFPLSKDPSYWSDARVDELCAGLLGRSK